jgi:hypothetical protein
MNYLQVFSSNHITITALKQWAKLMQRSYWISVLYLESGKLIFNLKDDTKLGFLTDLSI